ncbi:DNA helicase/exodeoxyribonuclease V, beta subunit [Paraburkholderia hospita]|uniref:RecBCD enzyme subunit RecB n=1 Tax=Paraburkholderia hospita TaxID=169430 RepID=A0ABP2PMN3_9BURK|nr:exodeoxyribonuclease V subunit beta [Paraburkholderia hospita]EIM98562.1 DNA helicase/exodeoxyribonuclease V, beta subunit [Paraburkholderia hospita]OUL86616.1 exodeoxyribonuclease V subunit beta [Paraburkholderia hospita]
MNAPNLPASVMHAPQPLDPLRFALAGRSLIEASAGTGKTFTIAMLYVRLVLGHDPSNGHARPLTPPEILVVTFTDAATKELRDRIRARLTEAAGYFQAEPQNVTPLPPGKIDLLHTLRDEYPPQQWPACARRLQLAAEWMDEAAVSTIHAWCNRMLREHAFNSDSLFTQTLETDQSELLAEVVRDYWRTFMAPLAAADAATASEWVSGPPELQKKLRNLIDVAPLLVDAPAPADALQAAQGEADRRLAALKAPWNTWPGEMKALLDAARANKQYVGAAFGKANCERWLNELAAWAGDPQKVSLSLTDTAWSRLTPKELAQHCQHGTPPSHPGFDALVTLRAELAALPEARDDLLSHAARWVAERFAAEQARRAQMGFDDLLTRLDAALQGPNGERLAEIVRKQFPVALIDEFQDTDPVQYRIFDAVYRQAGDATQTDANHALILIGDPKQAIYAFRGADIFTYLAARRSCGTRLYTLATNFRSTHAMVAATNHCFNVAEQRGEGAGAFLFREKDGNPVPFIQVGAQGRGDAFVVDGAVPRALTAWWLPPSDDGKPLSKTAYIDRMAQSCATEMVRLLDLGQRGCAGFGAVGDAAALKPLRPADIAVLVNNRIEADAIRKALARRNVRTVYLSDKDSVFESPQAAELQHWLAACAEPDDGRLVRTALATPTLGLGWTQLDVYYGDEIAWEACVLEFRGYRECWRRQGVLPMLRRLLNDFSVPARLLGLRAGGAQRVQGGERILTDLLHLAELLQQASTMIEGEHGLIRYLVEQRDAAAEGNGGGDARQLRLESDGDLVKVVTIHKSKGLEYPLVFLPFVCAHRPAGENDVPFKWHDAQGSLRVALADDGGVLERVDRERLGEDLRKLYVALTRACYATWIGIAELKECERSAIGYLLNGGKMLAPGELEKRLADALGAAADIAVIPAPEPGDDRLAHLDEQARKGEARASVRVLREPWSVASYSSLKKMSHDAQAVPDTPREEGFIEARDAESEIEQDDAPPTAQAPRRALAERNASVLHDFPRGSEEGSFLHDLLEWAAQHGFAQVAADVRPLREVVARRCSVRGWERWIEPLTQWIMQIVTTPLLLKPANGVDATSVTLSDLRTSIAEMEFWLAAHHVDTAALDRLVSEHTVGGMERAAIEPAQLNGMLKGFMDLVFEHEGRYYVADYKSNWLGVDDAAYTAERIRAQILRSRYDLQYVLYLLALHRLLKARLPDYDYDTHVGGAVYLFLRGLNALTQGIHAERPPRELIERLDDLFTGDVQLADTEAA